MSTDLHADIVARLLDEWRNIEELDRVELVDLIVKCNEGGFLGFEDHQGAVNMRRIISQTREFVGHVEEVIRRDPSIKDSYVVEDKGRVKVRELLAAGANNVIGLEAAYRDYLTRSGESGQE